MSDAYEVLGLPNGAERAEVDAAYARLTAEHAPDRLAEMPLTDRVVAERRLKRISAAYHELTEGATEHRAIREVEVRRRRLEDAREARASWEQRTAQRHALDAADRVELAARVRDARRSLLGLTALGLAFVAPVLAFAATRS